MYTPFQPDYITVSKWVQHNKTNLLSFMGVRNMKKEDKDKVINALSEFVVRVANGKATSETEVAVLPEVAKILLVFDS